ncbi:MAG: hypothetical protein E6K70_06950 [Planctomycetota bacterium]|nr:MAG: hypothetical protein E6K70_06950 [Planctomycetota bacterium]
MAKMLEILRVDASDGLEDPNLPAPLQVKSVTLGATPLHFSFREDNNTALVVKLPGAVKKGESITIEVEFDLRLPQKQGRWGQWQGITSLMQWLPVLAFYDEHGWQPTPFIPWHQPFFNEAGIYSVRLTLPADQQVACSAVIAATREVGNGLKVVIFSPICTRDLAIACSSRFQEYVGQVGGVQVRCLAFPEHEHHARVMIRAVCEALPVYEKWFGPYPYPQFTIAESYFGWNGNECGGLVMIDERVFNLPEMAGNFVDYLMTHEFCHQWWYNVVGTNGYAETWMDEAVVTHFSHKLMDRKVGRNNALLNYPKMLEWLPNIHRENYRWAGMYGTIGRGDAGPSVQDMPKFGHLVNLLSLAYDRGSKVLGMIEERLGETAFFDFMRVLYARYHFRIIRVADFQRELEAYTGQSWDEFFQHWLSRADLVDWSVEKVKLEVARPLLPGGRPAYKATVLLHQKGDYNEATVLGISLDGSENYQVRIPIHPGVPAMELQEVAARVESLPDNCMRVEVLLPCKPTQIAVDPDQVLPDRDPTNNYWKPRWRIRWAPIYTPLEETDFTNDYDKWNLTFGIGGFGPTYNDPWYERSTVGGLRADIYRTQHFNGGAYFGYRTDDRSLVTGVDGLIDHWPFPHTQVGFNAERRLTTLGGDDDREGDRLVFFGRYVMRYGSSLYLPPAHFVEAFTAVQDHALQPPRTPVPGTDHFDHQTDLGIHYHLDYLTPYWDPAGGYRLDATYTTGIPILGEHEAFNRVDGQFSFVKGLPDCLGPLAQTRLAGRIYGAVGLPTDGQYYALGGGQLFRGFDEKERQGSLVWIGSLEWRLPVVRHVDWDCSDHLIGVRNIWAIPFYDVGNAYVNGHALGSAAHALGFGLGIDLAWLGLIERTTLRFDVAKTVNVNSPVQFWFGITHPF